MTRIKICGLTRASDVDAAIGYGVDMLGFIHVRKSPRFVPLSRLATLMSPVPATLKRVIVVQDPSPDELDRLRAELAFDYFQFHGSEPPEYIHKWGGYKVFHMRRAIPDPKTLAAYGSPFLLDTQVGDKRGGTGLAFDWSVLPEIRGDFLVAGGLTPGNVAQLVGAYRPWGVDVSSGVEEAPGSKHHPSMREFVDNVRRASQS